MKINKDPQGIYQEVLKDIDYKTAMKFTTKWPENIRFIEGDQWPAPTDATKYMPRPVINQCDFIVENKRSNILSQQLAINFKLKELPQDGSEPPEEVATDFTDMAKNTWEEIDQETLNSDMVNDVLSVGSGILFYFFDNDFNGGTYKPYKGRICGETIDPMDITFGNNQLKPTEIQKQPFIILKRRKDCTELQERAKKTGSDWELIEPDKQQPQDEKYDNAKVISQNSNECDTYTKLYKENGEVYWTEVTRKAIVQKPRPLSPDKTQPFKLYPATITVFKRKKKCTYGRSIIEDIIPNQKALNWGMGMMLLAVQQTAWPKVIAKMGALAGQTITNEPGEILIDNFPQAGVDGIKFMQPPNFSNFPMTLTENLLEMTRQVTGVTEVSTGEQMGANMAAASIIALQNQAKKPNESYMKVVISTMKEVGKIFEEFYKCFYTLPVPIKGKNEVGEPISKTFNGSQGRGIEFDLSVDVGPSSGYSESLQMTMLDSMVKNQWISKYQYMKYAPPNLIPQGLREEMEREYEQVKLQQEQQTKLLAEQQTMQGHAQNIMGNFNQEEQQMLKDNPQMINNAMQQVQGGGQ